MREREGARFITITNSTTTRIIPRAGLFAAAKAGLEALTDYLSFELAPYGIVANCVRPGLVQTGVFNVRPDFEHGLLVIEGEVRVGDTALAAGPLCYLGTGRDALELSAARPVRAVLLGGEPFPDDLVMWWNFVGRSHEEIAAARDEWEHGDRSGRVSGHGGDRIPAPELPTVRLRPRRRR